MLIKVNNLNEGTHNLKFEEKIDELELKEPFTGNYQADIKVTKLHNRIILDIDLKTEAFFECDRCGVKFKSSPQNNFQMVYLFGDSPEDNGSDNIVYLSFDTDKIKLNKELRDYALLSIPMKKLCSEDCKGLCVRCGKNLNDDSCSCETQNVDSRWQPLIELKNKMNLN
ncbi:MAG TPA: DUF177 domain-containing protein [Ignavibacteriaceae bacterium]|nr:DUF177 domain-containing protein [Ignavibacteriaceae bacterium]